MKRFDNINVIPLIDVMLVLLAIVLLSASFIVKDTLNIDLPDTQNTQTYTPPTDLQVTHLSIDATNTFFIEETATTFAELREHLQQLPKNQAITLSVDKQSEFGTFVQLIDLLKGQSLNNLSILTEADPS